MDERVRVKILPLHNIGGVGKAGDVVWMLPAEAEAYVRDGYVELVEAVGDQQLAVSSASTASGVPLSALPKGDDKREDVEVEDHVIMKPQSKRARKK